VVPSGFESGIAPWVMSGNACRSTGGYARSGTAYSILGYYNNAKGTEYQTIEIPSGAAPSLTFWLNVTSSEFTSSIRYDNLYVEVRSTSGAWALLGTLATFSNLNKGSTGAYVQRGPYSLAPWSGQTVRLQFRATTDWALATAFRIDDVSVR
jgi:hypothetical protein